MYKIEKERSSLLCIVVNFPHQRFCLTHTSQSIARELLPLDAVHKDLKVSLKGG